MASQEPVARTRKRRSPIERILVWGVITFLLVVVSVELRSRLAFQSDYDALTDALQAAESTPDKALTEADVKSLMTRYSEHTSEQGLAPNALAAARLDTYRYQGLLRSHVLYVYYGHQRAGEAAEVISVGTEKAESLVEYVNKAYETFDSGGDPTDEPPGNYASQHATNSVEPAQTPAP